MSHCDEQRRWRGSNHRTVPQGQGDISYGVAMGTRYTSELDAHPQERKDADVSSQLFHRRLTIVEVLGIIIE